MDKHEDGSGNVRLNERLGGATKPIKPWKRCSVCGGDAYARDPEHFMRYGKGWFDCESGHGFYTRGFNT